eukprot:Skav221675  [mRNA]  locus=scaffold6883:10458:13022:- [translate_table: standard]
MAGWSDVVARQRSAGSSSVARANTARALLIWAPSLLGGTWITSAHQPVHHLVHEHQPAPVADEAAVRDALRIPVLSNGNVRCPEDVTKNLKVTGCEGVMVAEQLLNDPALFHRNGGAPGAEELVDEYLEQCSIYGAEDESVCFSLWGATNGHVIREHVHRRRGISLRVKGIFCWMHINTKYANLSGS